MQHLDKENKETTIQKRRLSIVAILGSVILFFCFFLWIFSASVEKQNFSVVPPDPLQKIDRQFQEANYVDRSGEETMFIDGLPGKPSPDIAVFGGEGKIKGKVLIDGKPGEGVVQLARWEGALYKDIKVNSDKDGNFEVDKVLGGRWSARAWAPPFVSVGGTNSWFMLENSEANIELNTGRPIKKEKSILVSPEDRTFGSFTLSLTIFEEELGENGEIITRTLSDNVPVVLPSNYQGQDRITLLDGRGILSVTCKSFDPVFTTLSRTGFISLAEENIFFTAPLCVPPPPTTSPTTTPTSSTPPTPTTTSTTTPSPTVPTTIPTSSTIVRPTTTIATRGES